MSVSEVTVKCASGDGASLTAYVDWSNLAGSRHIVALSTATGRLSGGADVFLSPKHARKLAKHLRKLAAQAEGLNK